MTKWHYTTLEQWQKIRTDGQIALAKAGLPKSERPAVWFSTRDDWEPTASKGHYDPGPDESWEPGTFVQIDPRRVRRLTIPEMVESFGGLVRVGVADETAPHNWSDFKRLSGIESRMARALYQTSINQGSKPGDWFCCFDPVPFDKWTAVEVFYGETWEPMPDWQPSK